MIFVLFCLEANSVEIPDISQVGHGKFRNTRKRSLLVADKHVHQTMYLLPALCDKSQSLINPEHELI